MKVWQYLKEFGGWIVALFLAVAFFLKASALSRVEKRAWKAQVDDARDEIEDELNDAKTAANSDQPTQEFQSAMDDRTSLVSRINDWIRNGGPKPPALKR